jgi:hypothetical protein
VITRYILALPSRKTVTVQKICEDTYIVQDDITATLKDMGVLEHRKKGGANVVINKARVREWAASQHISMESPIDPDSFQFRESSEEEN